MDSCSASREPPSPQDDQDGEADREEEHAHGDSGFRVRFERQEDLERQRASAAGEVASEGDSCAELAEGPGPRQRKSGEDRIA